MNKRMQSLVERDSDGSWLPAGFEPYTLALQEACLDLFDANCPASFAPNERSDYAAFLDQAGGSYFVKPQSGRAAAAFGLKRGAGADNLRLNWIMVHPAVHSGGVGRAIMEAVAYEHALGLQAMRRLYEGAILERIRIIGVLHLSWARRLEAPMAYGRPPKSQYGQYVGVSFGNARHPKSRLRAALQLTSRAASVLCAMRRSRLRDRR